MIKTVSIIDVVNLIVKAIGAESALELGCGDGGMVARLAVQVKAGMEHWPASIERGSRCFPQVTIMFQDIRSALVAAGPKSYDVVCGFDVLEHLYLPDARSVMAQAEQIARKLVLWWGPLEETPRLLTAVDGNPSMAHVRCISMDEFDGYEQILFPQYFTEPIEIAGTDGFLAWKDVR